ncbi:MAG: RNase H family protein, partial [Burkholderiaceae bacterium]
TEWITGWKQRGWKSAARQPVQHVDLWQALEVAAAPHEIEWRWVKGHAGDIDNERADALANRGVQDIAS